MSAATQERTRHEEVRGIPSSRKATVARPKIGLKTQVTERRSSAPKRGHWVTSILGALCVFGATYTVSSLWGNVEIEKARYREREARARAEDARRVESALRARVEALTAGTTVIAWAQTNGFDVYQGGEVPAPTKSPRQTYVASR
jgi:hypothetical protein